MIRERMLRAGGFGKVPQGKNIDAEIKKRLASKIEMPKEVIEQEQAANTHKTGWQMSACRGASSVTVAGGTDNACLVLGVQGHQHTCDTEEELIRSGTGYVIHYLDPRNPDAASQLPDGCPVQSVMCVPVVVVGSSTVLQGTAQVRKWLGKRPSTKSSVSAFQAQHRALQELHTRHGMVVEIENE